MDQKLNSLGITLMRVLTEVRYNRSFLYDDLKMLNYISKGLKSHFAQAQKDEQSNSLVFINPEQQIVSVVGAESTSIDMQKPLFQDFETISKKVIEQVSKNLDIDEYTRLGMRLFYGKKIQSIDKGQEILSRKFFVDFANQLKSDIKNPMINFTIEKSNNYFVNVSIRIESNATFQITPNGASHSQDDFIVFDLDVFTDHVQGYDIFVKKAEEVGVNTLAQILNLLEV